jgi:hypothetical protein
MMGETPQPTDPIPPPATENQTAENPHRAAQEAELAQLRAELNAFKQSGQILAAQVKILREQAKEKPRLPSNLKLPTLNKYGGGKNEDLLGWLFQVDEQLALHQVNEDEYRIAFAGTALTGNAMTWYRAMRIEGNIKTWNDFKASLQAHFYPIDPVKHARDKLHHLTQTGSVRDYTAAFRHLVAIIGNMSEDEKLDRYVRGLKTRTRCQVELKEPDSFDEACRLAELIDVSNDRVFGGANHSRFAYLPSKPRRQGPEPMDLGAMPDNREKPKFKKLTPEEKERRRKEGLCLYCGSDKHKLEDCKLRRPQGKGPQRPNRGA